MLDQVACIAQAAEVLTGTAGTPQERLAKGFKAFRKATICIEHWPVDLWEEYDRICNTLLAAGTWQKTIDRMDSTTAGECARKVSKAMRDLAIGVELATGRTRPPVTMNSLSI